MTLVDAPMMPDHKYLNTKRVVHTKDTTGIYLNESVNTLKKGSFLPWPRAKRMAYNGEMLTIYDDNGNAELSYKIHA